MASKTYVWRDGKWVDKKTVKAPSLHIMPDIKDYQVVGPEYGKVISSRSKHREYLKRHGLVEIGDQKPSWMKKK
jgi:hypothetical protein